MRPFRATQRYWLYLPVFTLLLSGCPGYTLVKNRDLKKKMTPITVVDSSAVMMLRQQLASAQSRYKADSIRMSNQFSKTIATQDTVLRNRDSEITSLKEQLAKATTELDRIKRRIASPRS